MNRICSIFYVLFFLGLSFSISAQNIDSTNKVDEIVELSDIPQHIKITTEFIVNVTENFDDKYTIAPLRTELNNYFKEFDSIKILTEGVDISRLSYVKVKELDFLWEDIEGRLFSFESSIKALSEKIDSKNSEIVKRIELNNSLVDLATQEKTSKILVENLNDIKNNLKNLAKKFDSSSKEVFNNLGIISDHNIFITSINQKTNDNLEKKQGQIFSKDSQPFWLLFNGLTIYSLTENKPNNVVGRYHSPLEDFLDEFSEQFLFDLLLFGLIILGVVLLKRLLKGVKLKENENNSLLKILDRPLDIAFLFYILVFYFNYENLPLLIRISAIGLLIVSLIRILFVIVQTEFKTPLITFSLVFFSQQLVMLYSGGSALERFALLLLPLLLILLINFFSKRKKIISNYNKKVITSIVEITINIFYLILALTLVTNIFGYVTLSRMLVNGIVISILAFILLSTNVVILQSLILWFTKTKLAQKSNIIKLNSSKVIKIANRAIALIGFLLFARIMLHSFSLYELFYSGFNKLMHFSFGIGSFSLSLYSLLSSIFIVWLSVMVSKTTKFILEKDIYPRVKLPRGIPGTITSLSRYSILTIGIFIAFISVGLDLSKFTLLAGALGVGIGFGLQDLVNNFISGILLIFERPIQVGDVIELDSLVGEVGHIGIRTSVVRTFDGADVIIPNGQLISSRLTNWTFSDTKKRIEVKVGVEYGTEINKVISILTEIATAHNDIFKDPEPTVLFHNFGDSSLDFELRCWTYITNDWLKIKTDLFVAVNNRFNEEGITIPFPQQDIHIIKENGETGEV